MPGENVGVIRKFDLIGKQRCRDQMNFDIQD